MSGREVGRQIGTKYQAKKRYWATSGAFTFWGRDSSSFDVYRAGEWRGFCAVLSAAIRKMQPESLAVEKNVGCMRLSGHRVAFWPRSGRVGRGSIGCRHLHPKIYCYKSGIYIIFTILFHVKHFSRGIKS